MTHPFRSRRGLLMLCCAIITSLTLLAACSAAPQASTPNTATTTAPTEPPTPLPPTVTPTTAPSPTALPSATATLAPSETPLPSATATIANTPTLGLADQASTVSGWCQSKGMLVGKLVAAPPSYAIPWTVKDDGLDVNNLPASACYIYFTFNQELTAQALDGLKFQVFEYGAKKPWLEMPLAAVDDAPLTAGAVLTHAYLIEPPFWDIEYTFALARSDGSIVTQMPARMHRWKPDLCFNGEYPDINTLRCPLWQDLHPWDPGYGKPLKTFTPEPNP